MEVSDCWTWEGGRLVGGMFAPSILGGRERISTAVGDGGGLWVDSH